MIFPIGNSNDAFAKYFKGQSYLAPISLKQGGAFNVTFEQACRFEGSAEHKFDCDGNIVSRHSTKTRIYGIILSEESR